MFDHPNSARIYGPAGSGKTRALIDTLRDHVDDGDFQLHEGIICSFTRAAAYDIARRVNPEGEPARYHTTLHALCKRYYAIEGELAESKMGDFFGERGIMYRSTRSPDPEEWASSMDASDKSPGALIANFWSWCRNRLVSVTEGKKLVRPDTEIERWWMGDRMEKLWQEYVDWKASINRIDFTDMLETALRWPPERNEWPFFVLDEAQDSTPLQWAVAQAFAKCADVAYIAGDDDQAIYTWSGATPHEFLSANVTQTDTLHVNHRSGSVIVEAAQKFIRLNKERQEKNILPSRHGGVVETTQDVPIIDLNESTFIMGRAWYLLEPLLAKMQEQAIPFLDRRGKYGVTGAAAVPYMRYLRLKSGQSITLDEWNRLLDAIPARGPWLMPGEKARVARIDKKDREATYVRLANVTDYGATDELRDAIKAGSIDPLQRLDATRLGYLREVALRYGTDYLSEQKAGAVCQAGSIHAFKGLEADHAIIHSGMPPMASREAFRDPEPERRVLYVALTRARERITHFEGNGFAQWKEVLR